MQVRAPAIAHRATACGAGLPERGRTSDNYSMTQPSTPGSAAAAMPLNEGERVAALQMLGVLDSAPEPVFDDLVWLASQCCDVPIALISLIDETRQWFKASCGLGTSQTPREIAFCSHALASTQILEVPDALEDPRFSSNPMVLDEPRIRFYAGSPLVGSAGHVYGTLCVIDRVPRHLSGTQREALQRLSRQVVSQLEARQGRREAQIQAGTLGRLLEAMPDAVVSCGPDGLLGEFNHVARAWHGTDPRSLPPSEWAEHFDLFEASGTRLLATGDIPLLAAWRGETVRGFELVIKARGQAPRSVLCNASPLFYADGTKMGAVCLMHDVTALRAATRAATIAAQRFSGAFSAATHGMVLVATTGHWIEVNDAICDMLGYSRDELLHMDFRRLTHPDDLMSHRDHIDRLVRRETQNYQLGKRYVRKDGETVWAHLAVSLVRDEFDQPLHFVAQIQDVTEQRSMEERLRDSERRMRSILENTEDAFIVADEDGHILEWNRAAQATFGWRRAEVLGRPMAEAILAPAMRTHSLAALMGNEDTRARRQLLPGWHRDQHEFPMEITLSQVQLESSRIVTAFMHDISERVAADQQLRRREAQLQLMADSVPALIAHVDADLRYQFANKAYGRWFGKDPAQIVGRSMDEVLGPAHFAKAWPYIDRVLKGERVQFEAEVTNAAGETRVMFASYIPDVQPEGLDPASAPAVGFHLTVTDITIHKDYANRLAISSARLERALEGAELGLWELNIEAMTLQVDARGSAMLGFGPTEVTKTVPEWTAALHPLDQEPNVAAFRRHLGGLTESYENEFRVQGPQGPWIWLFSRGKVIRRSATGAPSTIIGTFMDITQRKLDEEALARAALLLRQSGAMARVGGWTLNPATGEAAWTDEVYRIHDLEPQTAPDLSQALNYYTEASRPLIGAAVQRCMDDGTPWDLELELISHKGRHLWVRAQGEPTYQDGQIVQLSGAFQDITERKHSELQLQRLNATLAELSYTDALTGLGNRRLFDEALSAEWGRTRRQDASVALLMIDIDHFKHYNDMHGHQAGDECLRQVGAVLQGALFRAHEKPMRYGGEEFVVLLPGTTGDEAQVVAQRVLQAFDHAALPHGASPLGPHVTLSIGVAALQPTAEVTEKQLVRDADQALYQAKAAGRARFMRWR